MADASTSKDEPTLYASSNVEDLQLDDTVNSDGEEVILDNLHLEVENWGPCYLVKGAICQNPNE